jgi:hypothetical protein
VNARQISELTFDMETITSNMYMRKLLTECFAQRAEEELKIEDAVSATAHCALRRLHSRELEEFGRW